MNNEQNSVKGIKGDLLVTLAMLIFGSYALFLKLLPAIPVISFLFAMQVVGMICFFILTARKGFRKGLFPKTTTKVNWILLALAVTTTANDLCYFYAFRLTSVANASVAHQLVSIFLLFLAPLFLKEKTKRSEWISLVVALVGVLVFFGPAIGVSRQDTMGILLGLLSAFFYACFVLIYRYFSPKRGYPTDFVDFANFWRYTLSTAILLPFIPHFGGFGVIYENGWILAAFGMLFAVIASRIHNIGLSRARPLHSSIIGKSEPVIATVYAFFFLKQIPPVSAIIGGALIVLASVWLATRKET